MSTFVFVLAMAAVIVYACTLASEPSSSVLRHCVVAFGATSAGLQILGVMPRAALNYRAASKVDDHVARLVRDLGRVTKFYSDLLLASFLVTGTIVRTRHVRVRVWACVGYAGAFSAIVAAATQGGAAGLVTLLALLVWLVAGGVSIAFAKPAGSA